VREQVLAGLEPGALGLGLRPAELISELRIGHLAGRDFPGLHSPPALPEGRLFGVALCLQIPGVLVRPRPDLILREEPEEGKGLSEAGRRQILPALREPLDPQKGVVGVQAGVGVGRHLGAEPAGDDDFFEPGQSPALGRFREAHMSS
jgi:hypothetical protein